MRKVLTIGAGLILVLALSSVAAARGPANEFAVGSAKTEMDLFIASMAEHASLSAHNAPGPSCQATGQIVYKSTGASFTAKIVELTIDPLSGKSAFFGGPITRVAKRSTRVDCGSIRLLRRDGLGHAGRNGRHL